MFGKVPKPQISPLRRARFGLASSANRGGSGFGGSGDFFELAQVDAGKGGFEPCHVKPIAFGGDEFTDFNVTILVQRTTAFYFVAIIIRANFGINYRLN